MLGFQVVQLPMGHWRTAEQVQGETPEQVQLYSILTKYEVLAQENARLVVYDVLSNCPVYITTLTEVLTKTIDNWSRRDTHALTEALKRAYLNIMLEWADH